MITIRNFQFDVHPSGGFWQAVEQNKWEPELFDIMDKFLTPSSIVFDLGAWIGPFTLYASRLCKHCYSMEPDRVAYAELLRNISANNITNVTTHEFAVMGYDGEVLLGACGNFGGSGTSWKLEGNTISVPCITLSRMMEMHGLTKVDFVKMDVEGAEESILEDLDFFEQYRPTMHLSLHGDLFQDREAAMDRVWKLRKIYGKCYDSYQHKLDSTTWAGHILLTDNEL